MTRTTMSRLIFVIFALIGAVNTTYALDIDNCTLIDNCNNCTANDCHWIQCFNEDPTCQIGEAAQFCNELSCNDTNTTTTTPVPTTTEVPTTELPTTEIPTTTEEPETTTTPPEPTTTPPPEPTTTPAPEPTTTEPPAPTVPPTEVPTTDAPVTTTAKPPPPSGRHFDGASFFGGMVLAVGIISVAFAAWRFYKSRNGQSYHTL